MQSASKRHEFRAIIDGIDLPSQLVDRINRAVQRAVLAEVADLDLRGDLRVQLAIPPGPAEAELIAGRRTDGIRLTVAEL